MFVTPQAREMPRELSAARSAVVSPYPSMPVCVRLCLSRTDTYISIYSCFCPPVSTSVHECKQYLALIQQENVQLKLGGVLEVEVKGELKVSVRYW